MKNTGRRTLRGLSCLFDVLTISHVPFPCVRSLHGYASAWLKCSLPDFLCLNGRHRQIFLRAPFPDQRLQGCHADSILLILIRKPDSEDALLFIFVYDQMDSSLYDFLSTISLFSEQIYSLETITVLLYQLR